MKKKQHYNVKHQLSSLLMLLLLAWLTVCLPYVAESNHTISNQIEIPGEEAPNLDQNSPLSNTTEEKPASGTSLLSEYLHDQFFLEQNFMDISSLFKRHPSDLYFAFHPELIIPPPEV
jgi:hypothetical protein